MDEILLSSSYGKYPIISINSVAQNQVFNFDLCFFRSWKKNMVFIGQGGQGYLYSSWGPSHPPVPWKYKPVHSPVRHVCNGVGLSHLSDYHIQQSVQTISK